ncbi:hypothetical protein KBC75_00255 [Candidatus Shapirobacteria bacterium]|nr:hypothetical protein [Candidatus Shapirobacteria bacterium]
MFEKTRLKLTGWYLMIIMVVSLSFSGVIYRIVTQEIDRFAQAQRSRTERRMMVFPGGPTVVFLDTDLVAETKKRLVIELMSVNVLVLIISGWLAYLLSGKTLKPIQEMVEEQNRFISDASHELKTPLTSLKTAMEVSLRDKNFSLNEAKEQIKENIEEVNKLQSLSEGLLELSRFEQPKQINDLEKIVLPKSIASVVKTLKPIATKKEVKIINLIKGGGEIKGNEAELNKLWTILIENAIKYTNNTGEVKLELGETKNHWQVIISDNGVGIAPADVPHIFDRFYRADSARTKAGNDGYGLGLAIAKKIIESHNAKVEVQSEINKGTSFKLTFRKEI